MNSPSELIRQLNYYGVHVLKGDSGIRVKLPKPLPPEAIQLLRELKRLSKAESWDEEKIIQIYVDMLARQNKRYPKGALEFTYQSRPDLLAALQKAEANYTAAYHQQDMSGCRQAISKVEAVLIKMIEAFELEHEDIWQEGRD
ncbi:MAG: hypothetical protein A4E52_00434 [Pelotomaculum sp. PtaB.Bin013]|uniref:Uncharacterized protein n=1 Tax=Pelotomaculum isophthalicicum JI TaxID=947010 RepID=A0A9X4H802_9FIRM|nr:hypothetical protein [Pelotomaculum isophthalicicum]MDF9408269.1 hypothetical protein [Pelotomaculum isophthalicicum JI]OPX91615.1 MAG: hypothetical protein A4E52_00434 [Pelotomaculum sp. PtaB.Bin013]